VRTDYRLKQSKLWLVLEEERYQCLHVLLSSTLHTRGSNPLCRLKASLFGSALCLPLHQTLIWCWTDPETDPQADILNKSQRGNNIYLIQYYLHVQIYRRFQVPSGIVIPFFLNYFCSWSSHPFPARPTLKLCNITEIMNRYEMIWEWW
jgi:hypothetical protein